MVETKKHDVFNALIERRMGTSINPPPTPEDRDPTMEDLTNQNDPYDEIDELVESPDHKDPGIRQNHQCRSDDTEWG